MTYRLGAYYIIQDKSTAPFIKHGRITIKSLLPVQTLPLPINSTFVFIFVYILTSNNSNKIT